MNDVKIDVAFDFETILINCDIIKKSLQNFHEKYDLTNYLFTKQIRIQPYVIPYSHPILTLNTRYVAEPNQLLLTYLHEQIHWYCCSKEPLVNSAIAELRQIYPLVPEEAQGGAKNNHSTYLHLVVCSLERYAGHRFIGFDATEKILSNRNEYHWIYKTIQTNEQAITEIIANHKLLIES